MLPKQALLIAMLVAAKIALAYAGETTNTEDKILVVFLETQHRDKMATFQDVIEAYLGKYEIELLIKEETSLPPETVDQIGFARDRIQSTGGSSALWVDFEKRTVNILVIRRGADENTAGGEQILTRSFPNLEEGWRAECEAMAAFVRFALSSWLEAPILETPASDQNYSIQALDDERPWPVADETEDSIPAASFSASASYTAIATDGFDIIQNGASISTNLTFYNLWYVFFGVDILNFHDPANNENAMHRLPLFLGAGVFFGSPKWALGFNLALELDVVYFSRVIGQTIHRYNPGADASLTYRYKLSQAVSLFASIAANIYLNEYSSETPNTTIYRRFQPQLCIGLEIWRFWESDK